MSDWDAASAKMDSLVDDRLADTIRYATDGIPFEDVAGYVIPYTEGLALGEIDPSLGSRYRVKIAKAVMPEILQRHRLKHPKLGADTWRPAGEDPDEQGRYWIFDIQKAS